MQIKEIAELIALIEQSAIEEFEFERSGVRIRIRKGSGTTAAEVVSVAPSESEAAAVGTDQPEAVSEPSNYTFKAPIVGTFYSAPKPDADPFARPGDIVGKGMPICIIEAMKIFNQIESDVDGQIVRVLVENGQPVEYGEPLFEIRLS